MKRYTLTLVGCLALGLAASAALAGEPAAPAKPPAVAHRAGVLYAGQKGGMYALDAATGKELACLSGGWMFHLWGDRLLIPGDLAHESMGIPCTYTAVTPGLKDWKLAGAPFAFRDMPGYTCVCGYKVLMMHPFVDGYLFTRAVDVKKGVGVIMCWDLRQPAPALRQ